MKYIIVVICCFILLPAYGQNNQSVKQQITGKWVSEDDRRYQVVFGDSLKQDFYNGKPESTFRYRIKNDSLVATDVTDGDVFNYAIMGVTKKHLTLMYLARGNLLMFRKQTVTRTVLPKKRRKN